MSTMSAPPIPAPIQGESAMGSSLARAIGDAAGSAVAVSTHEADRVAYARDLWPRHLVDLREGRAPGERPQAIVWPTTPEEVSSIVAFCAREGVPIVPFGAGSGVCGGILPDARTVVIDLKKMRRTRGIDPHASTLEIEAGAMGITLEEDLGRAGFTIGHFPSSILCSTVGGWIAARGAGQCSGLYGKIEDMIVDLEVIDGRGDLLTLKRRTSNPDLIPLIVGSEGTLGIVTAATMRLHPAPITRGFASFAFRSTEAGWEAMRALFQAGLRPAVARLYDPFDAAIARMGGVKSGGHEKKVGEIGAGGTVLRTILRAPKLLNRLVETLETVGGGEKFRAMLVLIFDGDAQATSAALEQARRILRTRGADDLGEGPAQRWLQHRYAVSYRQPPTIRSGAFLDTMEVAAPWSKLEGLYRDVRRALGKHVFVMAHLSHAYPDGCSIYFTFAGVAGEVGDGGELAHARYDRAWHDALDAAIAAGGTLSHHHGVGRSKAPRLGAELGVGVDVVRALKRAFDPHAILNLGNLLPKDETPHPGAKEPDLPTRPAVDNESLLVHATAAAKLEAIETAAAGHGATLGLDRAMLGVTVGAWLDAGCPGSVDRYVDPVDHAFAGLDARLPDGRILSVRPAPRRAVGPDLSALIAGARGRFLTPITAHLRVHLRDAIKPATSIVRVDRDPALTTSESTMLDAIEVAIQAMPLPR